MWEALYNFGQVSTVVSSPGGDCGGSHVEKMKSARRKPSASRCHPLAGIEVVHTFHGVGG